MIVYWIIAWQSASMDTSRGHSVNAPFKLPMPGNGKQGVSGYAARVAVSHGAAGDASYAIARA